MNENIIQYITSVNNIYQTDETTEHSFRGSLETLLKSMLPKSKKGLHLCFQSQSQLSKLTTSELNFSEKKVRYLL